MTVRAVRGAGTARRAWAWCGRAAVGALVLLATTAADAPLRWEAPRFTREQMEADVADAPWLFVYGTRDPAMAPLLRTRAVAIARRAFGADSTRVRADRDVTPAQLAAGNAMLLGSPRENAWTARLAEKLPVTWPAGGFAWRGKPYTRTGDAIGLTYPHPLAARRFVMLIAANSADAYTRRGPFGMGGEDWRIVRDGEVTRSGRFAQSAAAPWRYDAALDRDLDVERERFAAGLRASGRALVVRAAPGADGEAVRARGEALLARMDAMGLVAPAGAKAPAPTLTLYRTLEQKGLLTRDTRPEHVDGGVAHVGLRAPLAGSDRGTPDLWSVAALRLIRRGARIDSRFTEPAAAWIAGRVEGEPLEAAVSRLYFGRVLPTAAQAATRADRWRSPLVWTPARAVLARAVWESAGPAARRNALGALLSADPPGTLDSLCRRAGVGAPLVTRRYQRLADSLARAGQRWVTLHRPRPFRDADGFQRGVCLAHAVSLEHGYLSEDGAKQLAVLRGMGVNAVSLTPFGYLPDTHTPQIFCSSDGGPDEETDESVGEAIARARALGLRVWLKPHLWTRGWIGDLDFAPQDWPRFFDRYEEFVTHYALLAEREGADGLFVGHELVSSTRTNPERWRALIGDVRRVYTGALTYGANWDEVLRVPFWGDLDGIAVSLYNPIAAAPTRDVAVLRAGVRKALAPLKELSTRTGKSVLISEVGYAPVASAPVRPWEEGGPADPETQRACYEALMAEVDAPEWLSGVYVWKWFTSSTQGGPNDASYSPRGKPAEAVMTRAMREWAGRAVRVGR